MKITPLDNIDSIKTDHPHLKTVTKGAIVNDLYRVLVAQTKKYTHVRIRRLDNLPITSFSDMQQIKNYFIGAEQIAVQVFPRTSDYIDNTNTYHLFSWPDMDVPNLKDMYQYNNQDKNL